MKRLWILPVLIFVLGLSTPSYGKDGGNTGLYVGAGGILGVDDFDTDDLNDYAEQFGARDVEFDNEFGINGRIGYHFLPWFALELSVDYFDEFEAGRADEVTIDTEVQLATYMVVAKVVAKFYSARPFLCAGLG
jgi:hypothetical protein